MTELVHERALELQDRHGIRIAGCWSTPNTQPAGTWVVWVEFVSASGETVVRTDREPTQSTLEGVIYWAQACTRGYFERALDRASRRSGTGPRSGARTRSAGGGMVSFRIRSADPRRRCG